MDPKLRYHLIKATSNKVWVRVTARSAMSESLAVVHKSSRGARSSKNYYVRIGDPTSKDSELTGRQSHSIQRLPRWNYLQRTFACFSVRARPGDPINSPCVLLKMTSGALDREMTQGN